MLDYAAWIEMCNGHRYMRDGPFDPPPDDYDHVPIGGVRYRRLGRSRTSVLPDNTKYNDFNDIRLEMFDSLSDRHYLLLPQTIPAWAFKSRSWGKLLELAENHINVH